MVVCMKKRNRTEKLGVLVLAAFFFISMGCREKQSTSSVETAVSRIITDTMGRKVEIPGKVETIAATGSSARLITYAGAVDKLVGVTDTDKNNEPGMPYGRINFERFNVLPSVGTGGARDVCYPEEIITLGPDLIFSTLDMAAVEELQEKTGIPVVGLAYSGIFEESVYQSLALVGDIMGTGEHCSRVIAAMKDWQSDLDKRTREIPDDAKPTVYTGGVGFRGPHGFEGTHAKYPPFTAIHAKNVVDETGLDGGMLIDLEKVVVWDPEVIFLNPNNMGLVNDDYKKNPRFYDGLQAVKNGKIFTQIAYNFNNTNIEIAIADSYYAGKILFPDQFSDIDPAVKSDEIFTLMLGQPYYRQLEESGNGFGVIKIGQ
jgi:iron complex transport system substrate-binding protein